MIQGCVYRIIYMLYLAEAQTLNTLFLLLVTISFYHKGILETKENDQDWAFLLFNEECTSKPHTRCNL